VSDSREVEGEPKAAHKVCVRPRSPAQNVSSVRLRQGPAHDDDRPEVEVCITAARIGTFDWDLASGRLRSDELLLELFGFDADTLSSIEALNSRVHPQDRARVAAVVATAINECGDFIVEYRVTLPSTGDRWVCSRGRAMCDEDGTTSRIVGAAWDATHVRERDARTGTGHDHNRSATQKALQRSGLLARVTEELTGTLDADEAVEHLAQLVVPALADWCLVTLVDDDARAGDRRGLRDVAAWHSDPAVRGLTQRYAQLRLAALTDKAFVVRALRTGEPQVIARGATAAIQAALVPGPAHQVIDRLAPDSGVVLPLMARGRTVGLLSLFSGSGRAPITAEELATATDVASRAGLALDNARLYRQQRNLAEGLQRSMLTPPPKPDQVQVVVRYSPAAEAAQVGGDWYDAFVQPGGATVLAIGDVIGHDTKAAAAMGQLRGALRTVGALDDDGPAEVLRKVDRVMQTLQVGATATAVVARLEQSAEEARRGLTRVRWSNAGHPPPLALDPDGTVLALDRVQPDLMLGVDPSTPRRESQLTLRHGATVLLYTDGLIERRGHSLEARFIDLQRTLSDLAGADLDGMCDQLLARMLPPQPDDDVALAAVRLHRQAR
jgi:Stage II sporulation protein E (SpoIIE)/PAS fold/GAF domain